MLQPHPSSSDSSIRSDLNKLIHAATIGARFRELLLTNPAAALDAGYEGESFHLTPKERELVLSIRASSLQDFATQLVMRQRGEKLGEDDAPQTQP